MKTKIIISLSLVLFSFAYLQAQNTEGQKKSVDEQDYLPKAGNIAIGADAAPIFTFVGNMFNGTNTTPTNENKLSLAMPAIYAKYYLTDQTAIRALVCVNSTSPKTLYYVKDDAAFYVDPLANTQVVDSKTALNNAFYTSVAVQNFVGKTRLRGFYGAQLIYGTSNSLTTNIYANPMTELNPKPTMGSGFTWTGTGLDERILENKTINTYNLGAGLIAGFEYYIMPRLCFGAEVSLNAIYSHGGQIYTKSEKVVGSKVVPVDAPSSPGGSNFSVKTLSFTPDATTYQQLGLYIMFHF